MDAFEERLVADASERVVNAHVDRVHVTGQGETVFEVRFGLVVLDLAGVDLRVEEREPSGDAVLFFLEEVERDGSGVVWVQQAPAFVTKLVAVSGECVPFGFVGIAARIGV